MNGKARICVCTIVLLCTGLLVAFSAPPEERYQNVPTLSRADKEAARKLTATDAVTPLPREEDPAEEGNPQNPQNQLTEQQWQLYRELSQVLDPAELAEMFDLEYEVTLSALRPLILDPQAARQRAPLPCPANSMFSQLAHEPTDAWTAGTSSENVNGSDLIRFESFSGLPGDICDVHWWGVNAVLSGSFIECDRTAGGTIPDRYNIRLYPDAGGVPAAVPTCEYLNVAVDGTTLIKTSTGLLYSGFTLYQYDLNLSGLGCCTLTSGWLSIQGVDDGQNCWLLWMSSGDGDGSNCFDDGTGLICGPPDHDFDLSMCLTGSVLPGACCNNDTAVCNEGVDFFTCMASGPNMRFIPGGLCGDFVPACGVAVGACCFTDGTCQESSSVDCANDGGTFLGANTSCSPNLCPQPCTCTTTITSFPYTENFEAGQGDWSNISDDDFNWTRDSGGTGSAGTGPSVDHTLGTSAGWYMYTESSSPVAALDVAILEGPCIDLSTLASPRLTFFFHMLGTGMGTLNVDISTDNCLSFTTEFSMPGNQGDQWHLANLDLSDFSGETITIRFRGVMGDGSGGSVFLGDMAIDDIQIGEGVVFTGACCFIDGSCQEVSQADCATQGGSYLGDLTGCTPNPCPQPCTCVAPVSTFPHNEDFETEVQCGTTCGNACALQGSWTNETDDDMDWTSDVGGTTSSSTGPSQDANPGTPTGFYLYTETSGSACQNAEAVLLSPCYDFSALTLPQMVFAYHMHGADMGDLNVEVSTDLCVSWTSVLVVSGEQQTDNPDPWIHVVIDLNSLVGESEARIRIRGVTGGGFNSDMAIDDITVREAQVETGACCNVATCTEDVTEAACIAGGGVYLGDFSSCGPPNPCVGACCLPDGSCIETDVSDCIVQGGFSQGGGTTCLLDPCPLVNDTCPTATNIAAVPFFTTFDNSLAGADGPPGSSGCNTASATVMQNDVWYSFTPPQDCLLIMDVDPDFGSGYDGIMQIYTGPDCNNLAEFPAPGSEGVGCFDDPEPYHSEWGATAGTTYWFQIGDWGTGAGGGLTSFGLECIAGSFGACCFPDGTCAHESDQAACEAAGGTYQGDSVTCGSVSCPVACVCGSPISTFPYGEDFEAEPTCSTTCGNACVLTGDWRNIDDGTDDFDWTIDENGTGSSSTGPDIDANPGTDLGNYAYTETSGATCNNATAILVSPCFDISGLTDPVFVFAYHMHGATMGDLHVEVSTNICATWSTELTIPGEQQSDETEPWILAAVDLGDFSGETSLFIRIRGVTGTSFTSDMAVDDLRLVNGPLAGACCESDGTCTDTVTEATCTAGGGRWQGAFTDCANIPTCGGACCSSAGCTIEFEEDCDALGGTFLGDDTTCSGLDCNSNGVDDDCDIATGASSDCNDNGIPDDCEALDDCDGDGTPDICDPDCNANGISDACDIFNGTSLDCQPDGIPDDCQLGGPAPRSSGTLVLTEFDLGGTDAIEIQNVSGGALDTTGWVVAVSESPYSDLNTVNSIVQTLPASMAADEIIYWTDSAGDNPWGSNLFWNPGDSPSFTGWAIILDDTGAIVDFAVWNGVPEASIAAMNLVIGPHNVTIGSEWLLDGIDGNCGTGLSLQRQGNSDNDDATDWICQTSNRGTQNPGLTLPFIGGTGGADCNANGIPDDCDIADCAPGDISCGDCNANGVPDGCELSGLDCNNNGVDDDCDIDGGGSDDCNGNGIPDECDIANQTSDDCNTNGTPDECEPDCNGNGIADECDIRDCPPGDPSCQDCQPDGIPDGCQLGGVVAAGAESLLYSQAVIPDDNGIGPGGLLAIGSSCPFDNTSAEDFTLADSASITRITWEGIYFGAASDFPGADNNFHVTFYEDNGAGNVGAIVDDFPSVTVTKALSARPPVFGTNPVYTYSADLPSAVAVDGGQRYWLSVNGDPSGAGGPVFGWMASAEGNAAAIPGNDQPLQNTTTSCASLPAASYNPGGDLGDQDADLAFALHGQIGGGGGGGGGDCNGNLIPDECDIRDCPPGDLSCADCNSDGIPDGCQLDGNDCNANAVPDDCEPDCNGNGIADECDIRDCPPGDLSCADCQPDGIPDGCQLNDTGAPRAACTAPDAVITVEILTDNFGGETTWELVEQGVGVVASGGPYPNNTLISVDVNVCSTNCYDFTIFDSFGDGICCGFGIGSYSVFYEGGLVGSGGAFGSSETVANIGDGCGGGGGCVNQVQDPGFEAGTPNPFWAEASTNFGTPLCDLGSCGTGTGTGPNTGAFWAWFGGISAFEDSSVSQSVVIPPGANTLTFWLEQIICDSPSDFLEVTIDGNQVFVTTGASPLCGVLGYSLQTVDISGFDDGAAHMLEFHSTIFAAGGGGSNFFVDDVNLEFCPSTGPPANDCNENGVPDECDIADGVETDCNADGVPDACEDQPVPCGGVDIKPGSCPNSFNRGSHGVLPVGLLGDADFDVSMVDISSLRIERVDGVGGQAAPNEGPPGPHTEMDDVGTPFAGGVTCDCHELLGDGVMDLMMHFRTDDVVADLMLGDQLPGALVELVVTGTLQGGATFSSPIDCIRLVPPGTAGGQLSVQSSIAGVWIDAGPLDSTLDGGGFANFERNYPLSSVITLTATDSQRLGVEVPFVGWKVNGVIVNRGQRTLQLTVDQAYTVEAMYNRNGATIRPTPIGPRPIDPLE